MWFVQNVSEEKHTDRIEANQWKRKVIRNQIKELENEFEKSVECVTRRSAL